MKYLVLFAVLAVAYLWWRNARLERKAAKPPPAQAAAPPGQPQDMVECPVCLVHLPRADALAGPDGSHYCSQEHRRAAGG
ncbi:hypothetical protein FN976_24665 [Caenimonas sedimenti]|uniref:Preprotein translocase subunit YajC n=1 Tax=Caenimonas sedimenti TaxID=2596921 RepID=A0A562ZGX2_9BURK|nr:PP0621 family protein [Caenimonas sedimenti]TWO67830.1 hypothetical protein FN976_24665 [Caenimonas sedimenti]